MSRPVSRARNVEIDPTRGVVIRDGHEQVLRAKTFQLLLHLLARPDQLVTKEELFEALWPETTVTDDALVQCVGEIRKAVGDDPRSPWFVRTVPKIGYRLIAPIEAPPAIEGVVPVKGPGAEVRTPRPRMLPSAAMVIAMLVTVSMAHAPSGTSRPVHDPASRRLEAYRLYTLGVTAAQDLHNRRAIDYLQRAVALEPDFAMAHARIGYVYAVAWNYPEQARPHLDRALKLGRDLDARERLHVLAWKRIAERDYPGAIDYHRLLVAQFPTDIEAWDRLGRLLQGEERLDEAAEAYERALVVEPRSPRLLNSLGGIESARGRHAAAIALHGKLVSVRPEEPNAWDSLGLSHHAAGHYEEALQAYDRALALDRRFEIAVVHRANALWELGRNREAISQYEHYIALAPSAGERQRGYSELFMIHRALGDGERAHIAAQRLVEAGANPSWLEPVHALDRGETQRARELLARLDQRSSGRGARATARFWYSLRSELALREGNPQQAIAHARAGMAHASATYALDPYDHLYADVLARTGDLRGAVAEYRRLLAQNPSRARTRHKLARVLEALGERDAAMTEHRRVVALWKEADADAPELRDSMRRLQVAGTRGAG